MNSETIPQDGWRRSRLAEKKILRDRGCVARAYVTGDAIRSYVVSKCEHGVIGSVSVMGQITRLSPMDADAAWAAATRCAP